MNVFKDFQAELDAAVQTLVRDGVIPKPPETARTSVEPPRDPAHGDMATNAAMVLAKPAGLKPRELAEKIASVLRGAGSIDAVEIAGPGFINVRLKASVWRDQVAEILKAGPAYGASDIGAGKKANVEYVSANPTGPMHVGHTRGAVFGDALANLLEKAGYEVGREYYINDAGQQIEALARSAYLRYLEALGESIGPVPEGLYPGEYLKPVGVALAASYGGALKDKDEGEWLPPVRAAALAAMMELIREDLAALGIEHETFFSEQSLHSSGEIEKTLKVLEAKDLIYVGTLEPPKGKRPDDWEAAPQTLFRSTAFGDDSDRVIRKSDGSWTYFAPDIAYHLHKYNRGYSILIDVWGADHSGYIKRMKAAVAAVTDGGAELDVKVCQLVRLFRGGEPVKMSKRAGDFITLRDVVDEVGRDAVRFMMLYRKNDAPLDFDFVKVKEQSRDNPVFYVQYAHARIFSVLRNARGEAALEGADLSDEALAKADPGPLEDPAEMELIRLAAAFPRVVEAAAEAHEPHRVAFYLNDLASAFHSLWNKGKDDPSLRFIVAGDEGVTMARLAMIRAVGTVIAAGLAIVGVTPVEEMR